MNRLNNRQRFRQQLNRAAASAFALVLGGLSGSAQGQLEQTQLAVEISGLKQPEGQVCLNLFDSRVGFPGNSDTAVRNRCMTTTASVSLVTTFANLPPGSYAVSAFHDANSDNKFNRNFVGIPMEGYGFSRNPRIRTGPPDFEDTVFLVAGQETRIEIKLNYF